MEIDLKELVEKFGTMVSSISHRMIQNKELAKEASQEVWFEVIKSINSFNGNSEMSTWIYTIAKRTILRYSKNEKISTIIELEEFRALPEVEYSGAEGKRQDWVKEICDWCLTALNHCLNNDARLIFIFRENVGLSYKQISEIMEMKEDNIRQISSRSLSKIKNFMNDTCPLYNPKGTCKCRICKQVGTIDFEQEYSTVNKMVRLADLYQKFEKELPRKNYWVKFLN
ncbi:RNA polymerase sigma factor [Saccharicrinis sp. FJH54]|uniref:RNA polymerase sigma factor n=1 Tax=Saccharicrinis sp. FJH54 TaxID=3344665 RepID=UPI0035D3F0FA